MPIKKFAHEENFHLICINDHANPTSTMQQIDGQRYILADNDKATPVRMYVCKTCNYVELYMGLVET
jgi:hypothetical protein